MRCLLAVWAVIWAGVCHAEVHVSVEGNDAAEGSAASPVRSLSRAVRLAQAGDKRVVVHAGTYHDAALTLSAGESGMMIDAAPGERPVLLGGVRLEGWRKVDGRLWAAELPKGREWEVRLLSVNGQVRPRARWPKEGRLEHASTFNIPWMSTTGGGWQRKPTSDELTRLKYKRGDVPDDLEAGNAEVTVYHMWDESTVGVSRIDAAAQELRLAPPAAHPPGAFGVRTYLIWNTREGMTLPGQWYHDRVNGRIVYWPLDGEDLSAAEVVVPTRASIIRIEGTKEKPVKGVTIRGLAVGVTTVPLVAGGFAAERFDGAVSLKAAHGVKLIDLRIEDVAGHGINASPDCTDVRVEGCEVFNCGAGGVYVGGTRALIHNNHVRGVGKSYPSAIGIYRGGSKCTVSHNEVHDCSYSAINYGGVENVIEKNLIYDCMKTLHDGAAIYLFGGKRCVVRGNLARDIADKGGYGASAYYLDEQSEQCVVERNVSVNVAWPSHNHMARNNTIRDNVFIHEGDLKITFQRSEGYRLAGNVIYAGGRIRVEGTNGVAEWSKNVLFSASGRIEGVKLREYSVAGPDQVVRGDTVVGDPKFVDWKNGDYRYAPGSAAASLTSVDVSDAGRLKPKNGVR